jgi:hypothetical protein
VKKYCYVLQAVELPSSLTLLPTSLNPIARVKIATKTADTNRPVTKKTLVDDANDWLALPVFGKLDLKRWTTRLTANQENVARISCLNYE